MEQYRRIPIHRALTRQQLMAGCDRDLFFVLLLLAALLFLSGLLTMQFRNMILGVLLWLGGIPVLSKLAKYDPYFSGVVARSIRYLNPVLPANGKVGLPPMIYKRWD